MALSLYEDLLVRNQARVLVEVLRENIKERMFFCDKIVGRHCESETSGGTIGERETEEGEQ